MLARVRRAWRIGRNTMYECKLADIDAYLASKKEGDIVGIPHSCMCCLVARALHHKYGVDFTVTDEMITPQIVNSYQHAFTPSAEIANVIYLFDRFQYAVVKGQWLRAFLEATR